MEPEITLVLFIVPCVVYVAYRIYRSISTRQGAMSVGLIAGGLYAVRSDGTFKVAKVLVVDPNCVHVRLYKTTFADRPETVPRDALTLGTIHDRDGFSAGHLPISRETFYAWAPSLIERSNVSDEELEGYNAWKESNGGVFT